jgi:hypothetical protein
VECFGQALPLLFEKMLSIFISVLEFDDKNINEMSRISPEKVNGMQIPLILIPFYTLL